MGYLADSAGPRRFVTLLLSGKTVSSRAKSRSDLRTRRNLHNGFRYPVSNPQQTTSREDDLGALFKAHKMSLLRYLKMRLGSADEAEEVLQEVFIRFLNARKTTEIENEYALLVRICSNQAIDRIRHNASRRNRERSWSDQYYRSHSDDDVLGSTYANQERQLAAKDDIKMVEDVLDGFSETLRTAFVLHRFEGLSLKEVAVRMNLAQSTVEKHVMKVSRHLFQRFRRS